ncbi:integrase family protein [Segniliparus rotundus DSM 44985]|uniref:Integrase family protein n=1 Tax=Segniliparus rotundus (strain ATCC BAA-972 / CDC 1076 / CIP 108378 / DSM 44985 / JCM 13578) TaxID=640132 RepID=D6ZEZ2_SEGRD|nr:tyrosine-type recombinase/integrase [Segniliparus rotundus]ADG97516.1 integrase family protein [Segniliparus rotundus DSM 44985]
MNGEHSTASMKGKPNMTTPNANTPVRRNRRANVEDLWTKTVYEVDPATGKKTGKKVPSKLHGKGKRWRARYVDDYGQELTKAFDRKADAQVWLDKQVASLVQGTHVSAQDAKITVEQWCERWLKGYSGHRDASVKAAKVHINRINEEFGHRVLGSILPSDVKIWITNLRKEGLADSYIYSLHRRGRQIFGDAVHDRKLVENPFSRKTAPPRGKQKCYVISTETLWALYGELPRHLKTAVLLGAFVGLRIAEAGAALRTDMDFFKRVFNPVRQWPDEPLKSEMSNTPVPVSQEFVTLLSTTILPGDHTHLVTHDNGDPVAPRYIEQAIRELRESGKVDLPETFTFHDLRHYNASYLIASGADIKTVQTRLRHASAKTTLDTYGHLWPDADESSRDAMSAILAPQLHALGHSA